jgi:hypothetical protein
MKWLLLALLCTLPLSAKAQEDNLRPFLQFLLLPHPICGINPNFDGLSKNIPPFDRCYTLALGYSAEESYPDPGVDALSKLIVALSEAGGWDQRFGPVSKPPLNCKPANPFSVSGPAMHDGPICTVSFVQGYLLAYNRQPIVNDFRRFERNLRRLNLSDQSAVDKVKQAVAVIRATGPSITFKDVADLLE